MGDMSFMQLPTSSSETSTELAGAPPRRLAMACQGCRNNKTKCQPRRDEEPCERCWAIGIECNFLASRRGRTKGSKNTLERMRSELQGSTSGEDLLPITGTMEGFREGYPAGDAFNLAGHSNNDLKPGFVPTFQASGIITPLDPHNLTTGSGEPHSEHPRRLTRRLLDILSKQFPITADGSSAPNAPAAEDLQDPLLSIADMAKRGWDIKDSARPSPAGLPWQNLLGLDLPSDDAELLAKWSPAAMQEIIQEQTQYFADGLHMSKRDVAEVLDPVHRGIVTRRRAEELLQAYFWHVHPQWPILDYDMHTLAFLRGRSALLMTTVIATGATAMATRNDASDADVEEAIRLHAHVEKLDLVAYSTGARSIEIIQAHLILSRYGFSPRTHISEQRWIRTGMLSRMALDIGLDKIRARQSGEGDAAKRLRDNDIRTKAFLLINERRFSGWYGQRATDLGAFELDDSEIRDLDELALGPAGSAASAFYQVYLFERDTAERVRQIGSSYHASVSREALYDWIKSYVGRFLGQWCTKTFERRLSWHLTQEALASQLQLLVQIARKGGPAEMGRYRQDLLDLSTRMLSEALSSVDATHMTHRASVFAYAAALVLKLGDRRDLVLRLALRLAGPPGKIYVPNSRRNAGQQMLAMLCANGGAPSSTLPPETGETSQPFTDSQLDSLLDGQFFNWDLFSADHSASEAPFEVPNDVFAPFDFLGLAPVNATAPGLYSPPSASTDLSLQQGPAPTEHHAGSNTGPVHDFRSHPHETGTSAAALTSVPQSQISKDVSGADRKAVFTLLNHLVHIAQTM